MSVVDFTTVIGHLVRVIWGAAAGKLHLASEQREGENQLRAGLCAEQLVGSVDTKVCCYKTFMTALSIHLSWLP